MRDLMRDLTDDHRVAVAVDRLVNELVMPYVGECCLGEHLHSYDPDTFGAYGLENDLGLAEAQTETEMERV